MLNGNLRQVVALALVVTTTLITMPVSAADLGVRRAALGSVSAVGAVELRGLTISSEGTLFAGDIIRARERAYAKIFLVNGNKIELAQNTELQVGAAGPTERVILTAGNVGFTASGNSPLRIGVQPFEIVATDAGGNVAYVGTTSAAVRAIKGNVTVRNLKTSESFVLTTGQERYLGLRDASVKVPFTQLASTLPGSIPDLPPQTPAGQTGSRGGLAMDAGAWAAVIAGAAVAGIAIWGLIIAQNNKDDIKELNRRIGDLQTSVTSGQAATTATLRAIQNAIALSQTAGQIQATSAQIGTVSTAAQAEIAVAPGLSAAQRAALTAQATAVTNQARAAQTAAASLQAQINTVQAQIAQAGTASAAQVTLLNTLRTMLETQRAAVNAAITALNNLLNAARAAGVNVPPNPPLQPVAPPPFASASVPV